MKITFYCTKFSELLANTEKTNEDYNEIEFVFHFFMKLYEMNKQLRAKFEVFEDRSHVYLVFELLEKGDLVNFFRENTLLEEPELKVFFREIGI